MWQALLLHPSHKNLSSRLTIRSQGIPFLINADFRRPYERVWERGLSILTRDHLHGTRSQSQDKHVCPASLLLSRSPLRYRVLAAKDTSWRWWLFLSTCRSEDHKVLIVVTLSMSPPTHTLSAPQNIHPIHFYWVLRYSSNCLQHITRLTYYDDMSWKTHSPTS